MSSNLPPSAQVETQEEVEPQEEVEAPEPELGSVPEDPPFPEPEFDDPEPQEGQQRRKYRREEGSTLPEPPGQEGRPAESGHPGLEARVTALEERFDRLEDRARVDVPVEEETENAFAPVEEEVENPFSPIEEGS